VCPRLVPTSYYLGTQGPYCYVYQERESMDVVSFRVLKMRPLVFPKPNFRGSARRAFTDAPTFSNPEPKN